MSRCRCRGFGAEAFPGDDVRGVDHLLLEQHSRGVFRFDIEAKCRAEACPGDHIGVQTVCFRGSLAEACSGVDVGGCQGI